MRSSFRFLIALLPLAGVFAGCNAILGIDAFKDAPGTSSGSAGSGGASSTTSNGGTGATGGSTTGGSGGTTTGGSGGAMSGGTGGTTSSGTVTGTVCVPDTKQDCYEGPDGTENVGICVHGSQTCLPDGTGFTPCKGQVLPKMAEDCSTPGDDDCNGLSNLEEGGCCTANKAVTCYTGPPGTQDKGQCKSGMAICNADGTIPMACPDQVLPADEYCGAIEDEDCNGKNCWVWSFQKGGFGQEYGSAISGDQSIGNRILVAGAFTGSFNPGGGNIDSVGNMPDVFLAKYNADGSPVWSKKFGKDGSEAIFGLTGADNDGIAIVGSYLFGDVDFGGGALGAAENFDGFFARFDQDGNPTFSRKFGSPGNQQAYSVKFVFDGFAVAGDFDSASVQVGDIVDTPLNNAGAAGSSDMFVVKYDRKTNQRIWATSIGGAGSEGCANITSCLDGDFASGITYVMGVTSTTGLKVGTTTLPTPSNTFLAQLDAGGKPVWAKGFQVNGFGFSVASSPLGPYIAGNINAPVDLGTGPVAYTSGRDFVVAHFDPFGAPKWTASFGGMGDQGMAGIAADNTGVLIGGSYDTSFTIGGVTLPSPAVPGGGAFLVKLDLAGSVVWVHAQGGEAPYVAFDNNGFALMTGDFGKNSDFGGGSVSPVGAIDFFYGKLGK